MISREVFEVPKKLSKGIRKLLPGEKDCLLQFWQCNMTCSARIHGSSASSFALISVFLSSKRRKRVCYLPIFYLILLI